MYKETIHIIERLLERYLIKEIRDIAFNRFDIIITQELIELTLSQLESILHDLDIKIIDSFEELESNIDYFINKNQNE